MTGDKFGDRDRHHLAVRRRLRDLHAMGLLRWHVGVDVDGEDARTEIDLLVAPEVDADELAAASIPHSPSSRSAPRTRSAPCAPTRPEATTSSPSTGHVLLRAVLLSVARRVLDDLTSRHLHVGALHIDTAAQTVEINGTPVRLSRHEFELLATMAADPCKVFSRDELSRTVWGSATAPDGAHRREPHLPPAPPPQRRGRDRHD